jgi:hypothetical protein
MDTLKTLQLQLEKVSLPKKGECLPTPLCTFTLADCITLFRNLPENKALYAETLTGVARATTRHVSQPEALLLLPNLGYRTHYYVGEPPPTTGGYRDTYQTLWQGDSLLAHTPLGSFDLKNTRKLATKKLIVSSPPTYTTVHDKSWDSIGFWLGEDPEDLLVPKTIKTWDITVLGKKHYFLFPEKGVAPTGCCRGISLPKLLDQFHCYKHFKTHIQSFPNLWQKILAGCQQEGLALA